MNILCLQHLGSTGCTSVKRCTIFSLTALGILCTFLTVRRTDLISVKREYKPLFSVDQMADMYHKKYSKLLSRPSPIPGEKLWKAVETKLEEEISSIFENKDKLTQREMKAKIEENWMNYKTSLSDINLSLSKEKIYSRRKINMSKIVVFNRISKTGSANFKYLISNLRIDHKYLVINAKFHRYRHLTPSDRANLGHFLAEVSKHSRAVYLKHQYYVDFTRFGVDQPRYINLVRDPVEQFISWYYFKRLSVLHRRNVSQLTEDELRIVQQSLEECVLEKRLECTYEGIQPEASKTMDSRNPRDFHPVDTMLFFCGHAEHCSNLGDRAALQTAKLNILRSYHVVGLLENMQVTASVLEDKLPEFFQGLRNLVDGQRRIVNKNYVREEENPVPDQIKSILRSRFSDLYELYEFIKQRLFKQYRDIKK